MYKLLTLFLVIGCFQVVDAQNISKAYPKVKLTIQTIDGSLEIIDYRSSDPTLKILGFADISALKHLVFESETKAIFEFNSFASAGGLGSTRTGKGVILFFDEADSYKISLFVKVGQSER